MLDDIPGQELNESRASHLFTARDGLTDPGLLTDAVFCVNKVVVELIFGFYKLIIPTDHYRTSPLNVWRSRRLWRLFVVSCKSERSNRPTLTDLLKANTADETKEKAASSGWQKGHLGNAYKYRFSLWF